MRAQAEYFLRNGNVNAAIVFLAAAETTFDQLAKMPKLGRVTRWVGSHLGEVRQLRIRNFEDYLIFYRLQETTLEILRILQGSRDLAELLADLDEEEEI